MILIYLQRALKLNKLLDQRLMHVQVGGPWAESQHPDWYASNAWRVLR
jgi:hypothetical protein